ncbi:ADC synthase [Xylogone sp. PMI_703]|nr:ADC synthase [Xylogone sp. PMI_703]
MPADKPLILFIDAYDSFSNNIISLLETQLSVSVRAVKIDDPVLLNSEDALRHELRHYAAVVCGPGPGSPTIDADVGIMKSIWKLDDEGLLPALGICMGFQSLCLEFGADIKRLRDPQHGMVRPVDHIGALGPEGQDRSIFKDVEEVYATHYQSLTADIGQYSIPDESWEEERWHPTAKCPDLLPLAWVDGLKCGMDDHRVLVGVKHKSKPFSALQYHPESICTNNAAVKVIQNWFEGAQEWNQTKGRSPVSLEGAVRGQLAIRESLLSQFQSHFTLDEILPSDTKLASLNSSAPFKGSIYLCKTIPLGKLSVPDIVECVDPTGQDKIVLESTNAYQTSAGAKDVKGRYSIIAADVSESTTFQYSVSADRVMISRPLRRGSSSSVRQPIPVASHKGVWPLLADFLDKRQVTDGNPWSPFWGGFMGYTTYELGLESIDVQSKRGGDSARPDLYFAWVTRSVVVDHVEHSIYIQELLEKGDSSLNGDSTAWMDSIATKLRTLSSTSTHGTHPRIGQSNSLKSIRLPGDTKYESKVSQCQSYIRSGDSYELCLTDQTNVKRIKASSANTKLTNGSDTTVDGYIPTTQSDDSWILYRALRKRQPAPFASYIRLGPATLVSSSPERFLKWDETGTCELRPMKGTVRKSSSVSTLAQANELLQIPKEQAENLMIVDLVRHDLHGVCGSGNVSVPRLMVVEEYASVFQMISVVVGKIPDQVDNAAIPNGPGASKNAYTGIDVLAASLPPGSMTGAPKKRSCEILQEIEEGMPRSLYSGVVGYMDVGGRGDFSVTIRCMFRWDDEDEEVLETDVAEDAGSTIETWHIGAGGAVTALSTPEGEREEMLTKLNGTLGLFKDS